MNRSVLIVAKWEFNRYFKLRDQLVGVVSLLIGAAVGFGAMKFAQSSNRVELAVLGNIDSLVLPAKSDIHLFPASESLEALRAKVDAKKLDGVLTLRDADGEVPSFQVELLVRNQPSWISKLQPLLDNAKSKRALQNAKLSPEQFAEILTPQHVTITSTTNHSVSNPDRLVAIGMMSAMVLVSFLGLSFFMTGITGEKQQRITEQIVSAISPQSWIDGKLIGLTAASFASTSSILITGLATYGIAWCSGYGFAIPNSMNRWDLLPVLVFLFVGGAIFWNCFYAAISSIINDPNTSARSGLLFVPLLPLSASFFAIPQPDGLAMRTLSLIPGASSTAMPIRLLIGEVAWWELGLCVTSLTLGIALLRLVAGRIFAAGIMLYGKEPNWRELLHWAFSKQ
jgi:ABC-2 type transport system permease protein